MADVVTNAAHIEELRKSVEGLGQAQKSVIGTTKGFQQQMGLAEKKTAKLHQWWLGTRLGKLHTYAKMFANLSKVANKYTDDTEELEHAKRIRRINV